ncbi:MAG: efflux RND transporter periplasmic adaptor subunit [Arenimonas sp.]|jgi:membrane fusion protein (multidrug efflux system)
MRRFVPLFVAAGVLLLAFLGYRFFFAAEPDAKAAGGPPGGGMPPTMVETARVQLRDRPNQFETIGSLRADESISVRPEIAGRIEKIHFSEGEKVAEGGLLFTLDDALTRADLNEANANLQNTNRAYLRAKELAGKQLIARADLDTTQAELAVNQARAASARTRLEKTQIRAPFGGVTGLREVSVGDYVEAGQKLVDLVRLDPIELDLRAPEVVLSSLAVGQNVDFGVASFPDQVFSATVMAIAPTVEAGGRSVSLRARLDNPDQKLRPGMSARVRIDLTNHGRALMVPEQAIWPSGEQKMVYLVVDGTAKLVPVTLGGRQPGLVEVTSGLKAGDEIVVAGQLKLFDGAKVVAKPPAAAPPATAAPKAPGSSSPPAAD